jgi:glycosyltransferase involved in cell wall biosynthesis
MLRFLPADHVLVFIGRFSHTRAEADTRLLLRRERLAHRCFFVGEVAYATYMRYLIKCDVGLVLFDPAIANMRLAAPNRFFDLMAMGVPMVVTEIEEVAGLLRRTGAGVVVRERRPIAVARAVIELRQRLGITSGGAIGRAARVKLDRLARFHHGDTERTRLIAALSARAGPLTGKRIALLTLRGASSNRRFLRIGGALREAGADVAAFDTDAGYRAATADRPPWLTTVAVS